MKKTRSLLLAALVITIGSYTLPVLADNSPQLSDRTFRTVNKVQELIAEENYSAAIERLSDALESTSSRKYDHAVLLQQTGFLYSLKNDYTKAATYFAKALQAEALPVPVAQQVRYSLAQLYLSEEKFTQSVSTMKQWFDIAKTTKEKPQPHAYITLASAYIQLEDFNQAIPAIKQAISLSENPSESWYLLLVASYYELKQYKNTASVLKTLTTKYPQNKRYWMQLSGTYMELNQEQNALAALEMSYSLGLFDNAKEYLRLANFQAYLGIPYRAASTLKGAIEKGIVLKNAENVEQLANFYHQAKALNKAIEYYQLGYKLAPTWDKQKRIATLMMQAKQFQQAIEFTQQVSLDAQRDQKAELNYLQGMAQYELDNRNAALQSMKRAAQSAKIKPMVTPWIAYLENQG